MNTNFNFNEVSGAENSKVYFEQVFAEKPAGGIVANPAYDVEPTTALGKSEDGLYHPIKVFKLVQAVGTSDTTIKIAKGSNIAVGDVIGYGKKAVKCTAVQAAEKWDIVTVTMGVQIAKDATLYEAKAASTSAAEPIVTPEYVAGAWVKAGEGDKRIRLVNGANLRKETACIAADVVALMPTIALV